MATTRNLFALAALATAAVPGIDVVEVRSMPHDEGSEFDYARVTDAEGQGWVIRVSGSASAGASQEGELEFLKSLADASASGALPFEVPRPTKSVPSDSGQRAIAYRELSGATINLESLVAGPGLAPDLGKALAAIHDVPTSYIDSAGLPSYEPEEYRIRLLGEIDEAAKTGNVPARLLQRWEEILEDVSLWRFHPSVIHGDMAAEHILVDRGRVSAIVDFTNAQVSDPAEDLAPVLAACSPQAGDAVLDAYRQARGTMVDAHLDDRIVLLGELAIIRWLMFGIRAQNDAVVKDACTMLDELNLDVLKADEAVAAAERARLEAEERERQRIADLETDRQKLAAEASLSSTDAIDTPDFLTEDSEVATVGADILGARDADPSTDSVALAEPAASPEPADPPVLADPIVPPAPSAPPAPVHPATAEETTGVQAEATAAIHIPTWDDVTEDKPGQ